MKYYNTCNGMVYTIQKGDTLYAISGYFQVPVALLLKANPYVDIYNLQIGGKICIPQYKFCGKCRDMSSDENDT